MSRTRGSNAALLSSESYDDDASTLRNPSTSSDEGDEVILRGPSQDHEEEHRRMFDSLDDDDLVVHHSEIINDEDVLQEEEEREKLLSRKAGGIFGSLGRKSGRRVLVGSMRGEYEMEEGYKRRRRKGMKVYDVDYRPSRRPTLCKLAISFVALIGLLFFLITGALHYSAPITSAFSKSVKSNGTHNYHPTTILVSLDGFRADYLNRKLSPTLQSFIDSGISPAYMLPSFPSVTFPNHYTIVTGLYPESHGIVGNTFWDPKLKEEFFYTHPEAMNKKWWGGEPIWETAEKQGLKTAIHMWPGSEAHIDNLDPTYLDKFNKSEKLPRKVDRIMQWLDMDINARPQFIASYVPDIDSRGHKFGPNSTEVNDAIMNADNMLGLLFRGIEERNLTNIVNVIVVSDHGMATTSNDRLIYLDDIIDISLIEHTDGWPLYGLRPYSHVNITDLHATLVAESRKKSDTPWKVYLRDVDMPERFHFTKNDRIAPLWIIPDAGWAIVTRAEHDISKTDEPYQPRGVHGYDNLHPLMRSIFVAKGPAFPHPPGTQVQPFGNWEVYGILCHTLGLRQSIHGHNGTMAWDKEGGGFTYAPKQVIEDAGDLPAIPSLTNATSATGQKTANETSTVDDHILSQISSVKIVVNEPTYIPPQDRPATPNTPDVPASPVLPQEPSTPTLPVPPTTPTGETAPERPTAQHADDESEETKGMSWKEYVQWRMKKIKADLQKLWGKVWD